MQYLIDFVLFIMQVVIIYEINDLRDSIDYSDDTFHLTDKAKAHLDDRK